MGCSASGWQTEGRHVMRVKSDPQVHCGWTTSDGHAAGPRQEARRSDPHSATYEVICPPSTSINPEKCQKTTMAQVSKFLSALAGTESMSDWRGILRTEDIKLMAFNRILPTAPRKWPFGQHEPRNFAKQRGILGACHGHVFQDGGPHGRSLVSVSSFI